MGTGEDMKLQELLEGWVKPRTQKEMLSPETLALKYSMYSDDTIRKLTEKGDFRAKREFQKRGLK